ncbi:MAG TPA: hypothetical protein VKY74_26790 [Chloroflexia bacterium]|nr:hypothetical protein [Chloroflexia bacterium]
MDTPVGPWCARLIQEHLVALADEMVQWARAMDPQEFPPDRASDRDRFMRFYSVIAQALDTGDKQAAIATFEQMAEERLRTKVRADSIIKLVDHGGDALAHLIGAQPVAATTAADALRQVRSLLAACRMILSKVNIQLLTHPE